MRDTLLISTYNRTELLAKSLAHLFSTASMFTLPDDILVVDDGGDDGCEEMIQLINRTCGYPRRVRYIYTHHPGQTICSHARNVGILHTDAEWIIQTEPEILFNTDVIRQMREHPAQWEDVISAGTVHDLRKDGSTMRTLRGWVATYAVQYKREWLMEIRGWDESWPDPWGWDDTDLLTRLRLTGHGQQIDERIVVTHQYHDHPFTGSQEPNYTHFFNKGFDGPEPMTHVVANLDVPSWGDPIPR